MTCRLALLMTREYSYEQNLTFELMRGEISSERGPLLAPRAPRYRPHRRDYPWYGGPGCYLDSWYLTVAALFERTRGQISARLFFRSRPITERTNLPRANRRQPAARLDRTAPPNRWGMSTRKRTRVRSRNRRSRCRWQSSCESITIFCCCPQR